MEIDEEAFLEHYGILGMKWGIRRGRGVSGVSRHRGATLDKNARNKQALKEAKAGKRYKVSMAIGRAFVGEEAIQRRLSNSIKEMNAQNTRIRQGRITIEDRLEMMLTVPMVDLVVSRTPNPRHNRA